MELEKENNQEAKKDAEKPRLTLVPMQILYDICKVREFAVDHKYKDPDNWKKVDIQRYRDAAFRHFLLYLDDPKGVDEESGLPHYYHLCCNLAFICELEKEAPKATPADEIYKKMVYAYKESQCVSKHDNPERSKLLNEAACLADSFMDLYECWDAVDDRYIMADLISKARAVIVTRGGVRDE
ncbi:MAG: hypothetical protein ILA11_11015 [Butyrivibrio sp.]|nr:hypothetical protein [Butyrivibrio sp.]